MRLGLTHDLEYWYIPFKYPQDYTPVYTHEYNPVHSAHLCLRPFLNNCFHPCLQPCWYSCAKRGVIYTHFYHGLFFFLHLSWHCCIHPCWNPFIPMFTPQFTSRFIFRVYVDLDNSWSSCKKPLPNWVPWSDTQPASCQLPAAIAILPAGCTGLPLV